MMYKKAKIGNTERGLLFRDKQFKKILQPGVYRYLDVIGEYSVLILDIVQNPELKGAITKYLLTQPEALLTENFLKVSTGTREIAVVYVNKQAKQVVNPGEERLFWKGLGEYEVKSFDISENYQLDRETVRDLSLIGTEADILTVRVPEKCKALLFESGVITKELAPGWYQFWKALRQLSSSVFDTRLTALEVSGQEMLTKDKVSLRLNLMVGFQIADISAAVKSLSDVQAEIYRTAQLALRQAVGEKTLDELLENKEAMNQELVKDLVGTLGKFGIEIARVGVKDIILPGDMRVLFNQVVEAEKSAQAQNIRRREETAATRSLLNTARLMENNPVMLRLKELESVERISEKVEKLTVYDGLKGVVNSLVTLRED